MANNATNVWRWIGKVSSEWTSAPAGVPLAYNWTNGADVAVDDYPDSGTLDTVTMVSSADYALETCAIAIAVKTITQGASYLGDICVANLTATTVTAVTNGSIAGGTITTANLSGTATATGGLITTANLSGMAIIAGATVTGVLTVNQSAATAIYGVFGTDVVCNANTLFDGNCDFTAGTQIKPAKRKVTVTLAFGAHTWAGTPVIQYQGAPYSSLWMAGHGS